MFADVAQNMFVRAVVFNRHGSTEEHDAVSLNAFTILCAREPPPTLMMICARGTREQERRFAFVRRLGSRSLTQVCVVVWAQFWISGTQNYKYKFRNQMHTECDTDYARTPPTTQCLRASSETKRSLIESFVKYIPNLSFGAMIACNDK